MKIIPRHRFEFSLLWLAQWLLIPDSERCRLGIQVSEEFARRNASGRVLLFSSARGAFQYLLKKLDFPAESVFLIPEYDFYVYRKILENQGFRVKRVPVGKDFLLNSDALDAQIDQSCRALICLNLFSRCPDLRSISAICRDRGITLILDNVHSFGSTLDGAALSTYADFSLYSFGTGKHLPAFGGGALVLGEGRPILLEDYENLERDESCGQLWPGMLEWFFTLPSVYALTVFPIFSLLNLFCRNYLERCFFEDESSFSAPDMMRMSHFNTFLLKKQLDRCDDATRKRRMLSEQLKKGLSELGMELPPETGGSRPNYLFYQLMMEEKLARFLLSRGIDNRFDFCGTDYRASGKLKSVYLPLYPQLTKDDIEYILKKIRVFLKK
ncbi:MAG: aminotransferase class I/II-fold pyridoxal phosphate-dependent enzyme [Candidatus Wallbacteria bacterium]|nr:aminotransferase class I/II-fold pyridoxal phosphate-dependent enzyme [Candidatus Wallbacteria bacterium]